MVTLLLKDIEQIQHRSTKYILGDYTSDYKSRPVNLFKAFATDACISSNCRMISFLLLSV